MNPNAAAKIHRFGKVGKVVLTILSVLSIIASIGLFVTLTRCDSPFRPELVQKLHRFGWALLPVALLSSISRSLSNAFLSAGQGTCVTVDWGVLLAFVVTLCLVTVFRYGVQLQQESDETL